MGIKQTAINSEVKEQKVYRLVNWAVYQLTIFPYLKITFRSIKRPETSYIEILQTLSVHEVLSHIIWWSLEKRFMKKVALSYRKMWCFMAIIIVFFQISSFLVVKFKFSPISLKVQPTSYSMGLKCIKNKGADENCCHLMYWEWPHYIVCSRLWMHTAHLWTVSHRRRNGWLICPDTSLAQAPLSQANYHIEC